MKILVTLLLILIAQSVLACQELNWTPEQWAENSKEVYIGRVSSISIPELDNRVLSKEQESYLVRGAERIIRIKVYETLKGSQENLVQVKLGWCRGGEAGLGKMVVLYGLGKEWHVKQASDAIAKTRAVLTSKGTAGGKAAPVL
ncbi:hypothetical protein [Microbulbifer spongiae]|uniref:DUF3192 domain-containing protein n=1 Tax=Microbulbifer spongiae TaxID=2944933 RepID=A0ABY9EB63_9GAMM|nr:hypothetical protein [Microbulbifer sp. MI-G]WKD50243.1 hypothetical protein M8T91_02080 [Microbulbifer sp. MI-G]